MQGLLATSGALRRQDAMISPRMAKRKILWEGTRRKIKMLSHFDEIMDIRAGDIWSGSERGRAGTPMSRKGKHDAKRNE